MASTTAVCNSFKIDCFTKAMDFTNSADVFRWALYTSTATNDKDTTAYTATNEISGTGYTAKGETTANVTPVLSTDTAVVDWPDPTWSGATFTAASTLLFNDTMTAPVDASVAVWDFGGDQTASGGDFVLQLPVADASNAILRIA
jgi:hypothetical protein